MEATTSSFDDPLGSRPLSAVRCPLSAVRCPPAFAWLPVESLVHQQKGAYYHAINASTRASESAAFIHFMLGCILEAVGKAAGKTRAETRVKTKVETRVKTPQQILALLREHPSMTLAEVAAALGRAVSTIGRDVARRRAEHRLRFEGQKKGAVKGAVSIGSYPSSNRD